ncbi:acid-sensing ion channel 2-like [Glandiceps talaboti]
MLNLNDNIMMNKRDHLSTIPTVGLPAYGPSLTFPNRMSVFGRTEPRMEVAPEELVSPSAIDIDGKRKVGEGLRLEVDRSKDERCCNSSKCLYLQARFRKYTEITPMHGVKYIALPDVHIVRRLLYTILVIVATIWIAFYLYVSVHKYLQYPVNTVVAVKYETELEFPAVTICNYNHYRRSYVNGTKFEEWQYKWFDPVDRFNGLEPFQTNWTSKVVQQELEKNRTEFELEAAHIGTNMIVGCKLGNTDRPCSVHNNFSRVHTDFGVCYTFNGFENSSRDRLTVHQGGRRHGLRIWVNIEQHEYIPSAYFGAGVKIVIHRHREVPLVTDYGIAVAPGTETFIAVEQVHEENKKSPYEGGCGDLKLKYFPVYTKNNCLMEKFTERVVSQCKCREPYMPGSEYRVCNYQEKIECADEELGKLSASVDCPHECDNIFFKQTTSFAGFPAIRIQELFERESNINATELRENYLVVNVFYEELSVVYVKQVPAYEFLTFLADFGGQLGLCLGASLLSAYETIDFVLVSIHKAWRRHK